MVDWGIDALFLWCVGVCGDAVGVVAPMGVVIQVTGLSSLGGRFTGRSVWLPLCGCGVDKSAHMDSLSSAPVGLGSGINVV